MNEHPEQEEVEDYYDTMDDESVGYTPDNIVFVMMLAAFFFIIIWFHDDHTVSEKIIDDYTFVKSFES